MEADLDTYVQQCAEYLNQRSDRLAHTFNADDVEAVLDRLDRIYGHLEKAEKEAVTLLQRDVEGRLFRAGGHSIDSITKKIHDGIVDAKVASVMAKQELAVHRSEKRAETGMRRYQLSAVRLAHAYCELSAPRTARSIAKRIMESAEIDIPSESTLSSMLNEIRNE